MELRRYLEPLKSGIVKMGIADRLKMVTMDYRSKRKAKRIRRYWEWVSSGRSYIVAPWCPYRDYEVSIMEKYLTDD